MKKVKRHIVSLLLGAAITVMGLIAGSKDVMAEEANPEIVTMIASDYETGEDIGVQLGISEYVSIKTNRNKREWTIEAKKDCSMQVECVNTSLAIKEDESYYTVIYKGDLDASKKVFLAKGKVYRLYVESNKRNPGSISKIDFNIGTISRIPDTSKINSISVNWIDDNYYDPDFRCLATPDSRGHYEVEVSKNIGFDGADYIEVSAVNADDPSNVLDSQKRYMYTKKNNTCMFEFFPSGNNKVKFVAKAGRFGDEENIDTFSTEEDWDYCGLDISNIPCIKSVKNVGNKESISVEIVFTDIDADEYRLELYEYSSERNPDTDEDEITAVYSGKKTINAPDTTLDDGNLAYVWKNIDVDDGSYYICVVGINDDSETPLIKYNEDGEVGSVTSIHLGKFGEYSITCDDSTNEGCDVNIWMYPDDASMGYWRQIYRDLNDGDDLESEFLAFSNSDTEDGFSVRATDNCRIVVSVYHDYWDETKKIKSVNIKYTINGEEKTETLEKISLLDFSDDLGNGYYGCEFTMPAADVVISANLADVNRIHNNNGLSWGCAESGYSGEKITLNYDEDAMYEIISAFYVLAKYYNENSDTYTKKTDILQDENGDYSFIMPDEEVYIFVEEKQTKIKTELKYGNPNIILGSNDSGVTLKRYNYRKNPEIDPVDAKRHPYAAYVLPGATGILNVSTLDAGYKVTGELVSSKTPDTKTKLISKNGKLALSIPADFNCETDYNTLILNQEKANAITLTENADLATFVADDVLAFKGEKITVTAVPKDGKEVEEIIIEPSAEVKLGAKSNEYEFIMPDGSVTISAVMKATESVIATVGDDVIKEDTSYEGIKGVSRTDLSGATITVKNQNYSGDYLKPAVTVSLVENGKTVKLVEGTDYIKTYDNNKNAGTAKVVITGSGLYKGTAEKTFLIKAKAIRNTKYTTEIAMTSDSIASLADRIVIYDGVVKLEAGKDYKVDTSAIEALKKGKVKVKIEGINNYTGSANASISVIEPVEKQFMIRKAELKPEKANQLIYNGKNHKFLTSDLVVRSESGEIVPETAYTVSAKNVKNVGEGVITIKAKGRDYKGSVVVPFEIKPETITFTVDAVKDVNYNGKLQRPKTKVKAVVNGREVTLKLNKDYKVTYKDNLNAGVAGYTITGMGNFVAAKESTGSFTIKPLEIRKAKVKGNKTDGLELTYNKHKLVEGVDYELSAWEDDANGRNKSTVTITGKRNFDKTTVTKTFKIK